MPQLGVSSLAQHRSAALKALNRLLSGVNDSRRTLPFGLQAVDSLLPDGGLTCGALHEFIPAAHATPAAFGFVAAILGRLIHNKAAAASAGRALPYAPPRQAKIVLVRPAYGFRDYGRLYGHGLRALGLDPARLILVETAHRRDALWAVEEALHSGAPAAIAAIIDQLDLKSSQRLHLAAMQAGVPLLLLRPAHNLESSAAATRWRIGTAEAARDRFGLVTHPRWHLQLERARNGRPGEWVVEYDHVAHRFSLAAALAHSARSGDADQTNQRGNSLIRQAG